MEHEVLSYLFHKRGRQSRNGPNASREISLSPVIDKVFEMVLLPHLTALRLSMTFPNVQQMAYQNGSFSTYASFNVQETVHHVNEIA